MAIIKYRIIFFLTIFVVMFLINTIAVANSNNMDFSSMNIGWNDTPDIIINKLAKFRLEGTIAKNQGASQCFNNVNDNSDCKLSLLSIAFYNFSGLKFNELIKNSSYPERIKTRSYDELKQIGNSPFIRQINANNIGDSAVSWANLLFSYSSNKLLAYSITPEIDAKTESTSTPILNSLKEKYGQPTATLSYDSHLIILCWEKNNQTLYYYFPKADPHESLTLLYYNDKHIDEYVKNYIKIINQYHNQNDSKINQKIKGAF
jgi:hypothetical protein